MVTLADRILDAIRDAPLDDDVLARRLGVPQRRSVNQAARRLEAQGRLRRLVGPDGKIVNALTGSEASPGPTVTAVRSTAAARSERITEDEVKKAVHDHLASQGYVVKVAWGRTRGIDIDARHANGSRHVTEAKAEIAVPGAQQANYFIGMLGELLQRIDDDSASYGIALPRNRQYTGLVDRLPRLAKERIGLNVFWVDRTPEGALRVTQET